MRNTWIALALALAACSSPAATQPPTGSTLPAGPPNAPDVATPAAPAATPRPPGLRLDGKVKPTRYAIELTVVPTQDTFSGTATLALDVTEPTTAIWLHAVDLKIASAQLRAGGTEQVVRVVPAADKDAEMVAFVVDRPIPRGPAELVVRYDGKLYANELDGIHRQSDRGEWYAYTQFEATDARRAFPCFDEPSYKVPFGLTLTVKREHVAVSNAPMTSQSDAANGMKTVKFADTKPLPTYLIAIAVGPFDIVDGGKGGKAQVPLRIIVPKGRAHEAAYATKATPELLALLEEYFGVPYPYPKLDQIAVPRKGGAMENAGLITYGMTLIAIPPEEETIGRKRRFASIATHELAHHWFGNLVTLAWWDDIWLNESFASWIQERIVERWQPSWGIDAGMVQRRSNAMGGDNLTSTRKIRQPIESRHDISEAFDGITYGKGSSVIAMFEAWMGPEKLQRAIRRYIEAHTHGVATTADFMAAVSAEAGTDVAPMFATFLDQVGTPLVTAELVCDRGAAPKLVLAQRRFTPVGSKASTDQTWKIPVCIELGGDKVEGRTCTVLAEARTEVALPAKACPRWVHANDGQLGYYRVHYQGDLLDRLLAAKPLTVAERVGVLGDVAALVDSGHIQIGKALERVPALARDQNRHITAMTLNLLEFLSNDVVPPELRPNRARFVRKVLGARARAIGWTSPKGEDDDRRLMRPALVGTVAKEGEDPQLIAQAKQLADKWLGSPAGKRTGIDPDMIGSVLGIAARNGNRALFDRLHAAAKAATELQERRYLIGALASFRDPELVKASLQLALSDELEARDSIALVYGALRDDDNREAAYQFMKANLDKLLARLPRDSGAGFIGVAAGFCDAAHRDDAAAFFKDRAPKYLGGPRALSRMIERSDLCIARKQARQPSVIELLKKH